MVKKHVVYAGEDGFGEVHILTSKGEFDPFSTFCGTCDPVGDSPHALKPTNKKVDCISCLRTFELLRHGIRLAKNNDL
ncbi:hypothetical protein I3271_05500 [Photobacterium leiognathi]|uniref:hypothetical protein n=1 Tax=Photobacterium leiognathi TaxID=553611 RepID=UPI001EDF6A1A|nr:hypothetical protein [Photobacterium leiognathi]MCG3884136.1 hypothetical protein [Photobacterium leiognathi]